MAAGFRRGEIVSFAGSAIKGPAGLGGMMTLRHVGGSMACWCGTVSGAETVCLCPLAYFGAENDAASLWETKKI